jgi:tRNA-dihydrouridine synthase 3
VQLHGRTRQQRYTRLADWDYIKQCVDAVRARETDEDCKFCLPSFLLLLLVLISFSTVPPIPIFGNGDIFSASGYQDTLSSTGIDGIMIGRGALIKPWIFTEIKENREWDISARERLDLIAKYVKYGLR